MQKLFPGLLSSKRAVFAWLSLLLLLLPTACQPIQRPAATAPVTGTNAESYQDPQGLFTVPIPTQWQATEGAGFVLLTDPEQKLKLYLSTIDTADGDLAAAINAGWGRIDPTFALPQADLIKPPTSDGTEKRLIITYHTSDERLVQARAALYQDIAYLLFFDGELTAAEKRGAQIDIILSGINIRALVKTDLSRALPLPLTAEITRELAQFIEQWRLKFQIPGAAVAIVQSGQVVYSQGFGVRNQAGDPLTPQTYMMIGSTGKSLTTLLMATLVDAGKMSWDTPAVAIYPAFAVKDPTLSKTITMRNLVCACTGVPRRDYEFVFNANELRAEAVVASLQTFEFFTGFGEAFQYSNQMVATGGYIAGVADGGPQDDLLAGYVAALQRRVLDPLGMARTTVSFDTVLADDNYATPYAYNYRNDYVALPVALEQVFVPVTPAGAHWSTVEDLSTYLLFQLTNGITADGRRVVSVENLAEVRKPQIKVTEQMSYGLGWALGDYKGQPLIEHAGNTLGFTAEFKFLPNAQLGIIVLTNAQGTNVFSDGVSQRLFELLFQQPATVEKRLAFVQQQYVEEGQDYQKQVTETLDRATVAPDVGSYVSDELGAMKLTLDASGLRANVGEFASNLWPKNDDKGNFEGYLFADPPMTGMILNFTKDATGRRIITMGSGATQYTFIQAEKE